MKERLDAPKGMMQVRCACTHLIGFLPDKRRPGLKAATFRQLISLNDENLPPGQELVPAPKTYYLDIRDIAFADNKTDEISHWRAYSSGDYTLAELQDLEGWVSAQDDEIERLRELVGDMDAAILIYMDSHGDEVEKDHSLYKRVRAVLDDKE